MNGFDLNINNYSVTELEELLTLDKKYNLDAVSYTHLTLPTIYSV